MMFKESQKFAPWVLWLMRGLLALMALLFCGLYVMLSVSGILLLVVFILTVLPPMLLLELVRLRTELDAEGVRIRFRPFSKKNFGWPDVRSADVIDYGFVGGWGVRIGTKYGTVYNTQGSEGLLLTLENGKKVVIGTQRKAAMQAALKKHFGA